MWVYRRVLKIPCTARVTKENVLQKINKERKLLLMNKKNKNRIPRAHNGKYEVPTDHQGEDRGKEEDVVAADRLTNSGNPNIYGQRRNINESCDRKHSLVNMH